MFEIPQVQLSLPYDKEPEVFLHMKRLGFKNKADFLTAAVIAYLEHHKTLIAEDLRKLEEEIGGVPKVEWETEGKR